MSQSIECFFDLSSPWTCLAFHNLRPLAQRNGAIVRWRPFLVGGVHNAVNRGFVESRNTELNSPKWRQMAQSLMDWAALSGVTMNFPSRHFPLRSVLVMRCCCVLEPDQAQLESFMDAAFAAYFTEQKNLDEPAVVESVAGAIGLDGRALLEQAQTSEIKEKLRANTDEAVGRGAFGSPSLFVPLGDGERLYFGNDQLPLVEWALAQQPINPTSPERSSAG